MLLHFLEEANSNGHPVISCISLCLDNDAAGITTSTGIKHILENDVRFTHIIVTHDQPTGSKDYNEALLAHQQQDKIQEQGRRRDGGFSFITNKIWRL